MRKTAITCNMLIKHILPIFHSFPSSSTSVFSQKAAFFTEKEPMPTRGKSGILFRSQIPAGIVNHLTRMCPNERYLHPRFTTPCKNTFLLKQNMPFSPHYFSSAIIALLPSTICAEWSVA